MKRWIAGMLAAVMLFSSAGCSPIHGMGKATGRLSGQTPADSMPANFQQGYDAFTANLLRRMYSDGQDVFVSPASLMIALGMTADGADGETLSQMLSAAGMPDSDTLNTGCRDLQSLLTGNSKHCFKLSDAILIKDSAKKAVLPDFLKRNEDYYGALVSALPFDDTLAPKINRWAEKNTNGMIKNVMDRPPDSDDFMFLMNALLFDGKWKTEFNKKVTADGVFHAANGDETLSMMHAGLKSQPYFEDDKVQATLLSYQDGRTAMLVVLPKGSLNELMGNLSADSIPGWIDGMKNCGEVNLVLPRFSLSYKNEMIPALRSLGITDAFDADTADFSRLVDAGKMDGNPFISEVIHQTALEVDESGTRAAAVTVGNFTNELMEDTVEMTVDRPFFCAIVDQPTGAVLFAGAVNNPQKLNP